MQISVNADRAMVMLQGPLRNLRCELVAWRKTDSSGNEHGHAWLPLAVDGVCLQLHTAHTDNQSKHGSKRRRLVPTKLVTWPISMGVQLATKLLPHVPVSVGNITLDFQVLTLSILALSLMQPVQHAHHNACKRMFLHPQVNTEPCR